MPNTLSKENELQRKAFELYYGLGDKRSLRAVMALPTDVRQDRLR